MSLWNSVSPLLKKPDRRNFLLIYSLWIKWKHENPRRMQIMEGRLYNERQNIRILTLNCKFIFMKLTNNSQNIESKNIIRNNQVKVSTRKYLGIPLFMLSLWHKSHYKTTRSADDQQMAAQRYRKLNFLYLFQWVSAGLVELEGIHFIPACGVP